MTAAPVDRDDPAAEPNQSGGPPARVDALVVGAGFAGLYMLYRLRQIGVAAHAIDVASDVGGTWYWNRYPGARCDIPSTDYSYSFDPELEREWTWSEKYATQPEILAYLQHVADRYDLRPDISFQTRLERATWDDASAEWTTDVVTVEGPTRITSRWLVMATGCLSVPKQPELAGSDRFEGEVYVTGRWPHTPVDFGGQRVAIVGTGSSGIQSIPIIARQADSVVVFQRTPNYSLPALNGPTYPPAAAGFADDRDAYREAARHSRIGVPTPVATKRASDLDDAELQRRFEQAWNEGHLISPSMYVADIGTNREANAAFAEFVRTKIRSIVDDPATAETLCPTDHPYGTKRPCLDTDYYETFNLDSVTLVDLTDEPIVEVTATGVRTSQRSFEVDSIVYATGFDALTGAIVGVDIHGRSATLAEHWADGPETYLGVMANGFPNLFMVTGPGSPSVLSNMAVSIEQHVDWITDLIRHTITSGDVAAEPTEVAEREWTRHVDDAAGITMFTGVDSWYMGANVPGKPRRMLAYVGGVGTYRRFADEVTERDYLGIRFTGPGGERCNDGVIAPLQVDVQAVLNAVEALDLPAMESLSAPEARAFSNASSEGRPAGPPVGEEVHGTFPGADGELAYHLFRPDSPGPHPLLVYYHGGGWVLGDASSDAPMCRDLCVNSDAVVVSLDYRHGPEHRFPSAHDDAIAGLAWVAAHAAELGGDPNRIAIGGWSAGANLATVTAAHARDTGGTRLVAQVLITPPTDTDLDRASYLSNGDGFILTRPLMRWFFDHYVDAADRLDPRIAPLHAPLRGLPPTWLFAAEFDPLLDDGVAYADALVAAGVSVDLAFGRGQIHTSLSMVDIVLSAAPYRQAASEFLRAAWRSPTEPERP